jgi:predicted GH43/DUF377 family glycosyl hydrolase
VIQSGNTTQVWWCGGDYNPAGRSQYSDSIQYESLDLSLHAKVGPLAVLGETQNAWDSVFLCNPKVIKGIFTNPLGNGKTYSYAMYYVATDQTGGDYNRIGVAFSNDGLSWQKYPQPIILPETKAGYGVGEPALYNIDCRQAIRLFYEDYSNFPHHVAAISSDGVHFTQQGILSATGIPRSNAEQSWGDLAFDAKTGYWYGAYNLAFRDPSTTGGIVERGQYGFG